MVTVSFMVIFPLRTLGLIQGQTKQGKYILTGSTTERSPSLWPGAPGKRKAPISPRALERILVCFSFSVFTFGSCPEASPNCETTLLWSEQCCKIPKNREKKNLSLGKGNLYVKSGGKSNFFFFFWFSMS